MCRVRALYFGVCAVALLSHAFAAQARVAQNPASLLTSAALTIVVPPTKPVPDWAKVTRAVPRKALVIGISDYDHATQLSTPKHDADLVAAALLDLNFQIQPTHLLKGRIGRAELLAALRQFADSLAEGDVAFIYFSGHGIEREGVNYLVPSGGVANSESPGHDYVSLSHLLTVIEERRVSAAAIILDACRTDPFSGTEAESRDLLDISPPTSTTAVTAPAAAVPAPQPPAPQSVGLARVDTGPPAMLLAYAAQPQRPAYSLFRGDDATLGSIFTRTIVHRLKTSSNYPVKDIVSLAEADVYDLTRQQQKPFQNPFGMLYLMLAPNPHLKGMEEESWTRTVTTNPASEQIKALKEFLRVYPGSEHSFAARQQLAALTTSSALAMLSGEDAAEPVAAEALSVFGELQSIATESDGTVLAGANRDLVIRQNWGGVFKSRNVGMISRGEVVKVVGVHRGGDAVRVLTEDGKFGYVGNLKVTPARAVGRKARLAFPGSGPDDAPVDWAPVETLFASPLDAKAVFKISVAVEKDRGISDQVAQLRALRIRDALLAKGVPPERVSIESADTTLPTQTAEVEKLEALR